MVKFDPMIHHHLCKQNEYVIKAIAKELPDMPLNSYNLKKVPKKEWVNRLITWAFKLTWPNGDKVLGDKLVKWIAYNFLGLNRHNVNHERRLRRAYKSNGILGVSNYLTNTLKLNHNAIVHWLEDFEQTSEDIRQVKRLKDEIKSKVLKA